jgi:hypothetical protein
MMIDTMTNSVVLFRLISVLALLVCMVWVIEAMVPAGTAGQQQEARRMLVLPPLPGTAAAYSTWRYVVSALTLAAADDPVAATNYLAEAEDAAVLDAALILGADSPMQRLDKMLFGALLAAMVAGGADGQRVLAAVIAGGAVIFGV